MTGWLTTQLQFAEHRWDYGYHAFQQMDFFTQWERIYPSIKLGDIIQDDSYGILTPGDVYSPEHPITFLRATDMRSHMEVDSSEALKVPEEYFRHTRARLRKNDIMLAIKGASIASGKSVCFVGFEPKDTLVNGTVFHFQVKDPHNPFFVATMLDSEIVKGQVRNLQIPNNAVAYVDKPSIHALRIPLPPRDVQDRIAGVMQAAYAARLEKLAEAEKVSAELKAHVNEIIFGKSSFALQGTTRTHIVSITKMKAARRFDVGFFRPEYIQLDEMLHSLQSVKRLGDVAEVQYGFMPTEDYATQENGVPLIRVSNIVSDGSIDMSDVKYVRATSQRLHEKLVREKDILMVQCGNTTGKVAIVSKEHEGHAYASFCFRIRPRTDRLLPDYLLAVLQSDIGHMQVWRSITFATVRPNTTKPFTEAVQVPIPPISTQRQIVQLIELKRTEAKRLRANAEQLVAEAKAKVERIILGEERV